MTAPTSTPSTPDQQAPQGAAPAAPAPRRPQTAVEHSLTFPRFVDWLQTELLAFPRFGTALHEHAMRSEQYTEDGRFVLRVELPGFDPDKDLDVTVADGVLTVHAERQDSHKDAKHSEFFYGKVVRTFLLPHGADEDAATATYLDGVLEVTVPVPTYGAGSGRKLPVTRGNG